MFDDETILLAREVDEILKRAHVDRRTLRRVLANKPVRPSTERKIIQALRAINREDAARRIEMRFHGSFSVR